MDAFFAVAGFPSQNVSRVVLSGHAEVLPIDDPAVDIALLEYGFLSRGKIPAGTHNNEAEIATLNMSALMVVSVRLLADIVYTITQSLWREEAVTFVQWLSKDEAGHVTQRTRQNRYSAAPRGDPLLQGSPEAEINEVAKSSISCRRASPHFRLLVSIPLLGRRQCFLRRR